MSVFMAPTESPGYMPQAQLAEPTISALIMPSDMGSPWPPYSSGTDSPARWGCVCVCVCVYVRVCVWWCGVLWCGVWCGDVYGGWGAVW